MSEECPVGKTPCQIPQCAADNNCILRRRESIIRILEGDVKHAMATRKVVCDLLRECLPLLRLDAVITDDPEDERLMRQLIQRIEAALDAIQIQELPTPMEAAS